MCKHLSANWFPTLFSLWALCRSALFLKADHALAASFLDNSSGHLSLKHTPDFPTTASWPWLTAYNKLVQLLVHLDNALNRLSPNRGAAYWGWFLQNAQYPVTSHTDTLNPLVQKGSQLFNKKILYSLFMFESLHFLQFYTTAVVTKSWIMGPSKKFWNC